MNGWIVKLIWNLIQTAGQKLTNWAKTYFTRQKKMNTSWDLQL